MIGTPIDVLPASSFVVRKGSFILGHHLSHMHPFSIDISKEAFHRDSEQDGFAVQIRPDTHAQEH